MTINTKLIDKLRLYPDDSIEFEAFKEIVRLNTILDKVVKLAHSNEMFDDSWDGPNNR